jgi:hypothetical protein
VPALNSTHESRWSWFDELWKLPLFSFFAPAAATELAPADLAALEAPAPVAAACPVAPLPTITDLEAFSFETNAGSAAVVDTEGLTTPTAHALERFSHIVAAAGGSITVTSAYRPATYQEHLQAVWDKWMVELRNNGDERCQNLRAEVGQEFERHQLLERQRPAEVSDHTRGTAFDASVLLPRSRRRASADALARRVGLRRPDVIHDPVHFRLVAGRA